MDTRNSNISFGCDELKNSCLAGKYISAAFHCKLLWQSYYGRLTEIIESRCREQYSSKRFLWKSLNIYAVEREGVICISTRWLLKDVRRRLIYNWRGICTSIKGVRTRSISDLCCAESISQGRFPSGREKYLVCVFCWWWLLCICWYLDEYVCLRVDCRGTQAFFAYSVYMHFSRCGGVRTIESGEKQAQSSIGGCSLNGISHRPKPHIYPDSEFVLWPQKYYNWAFHHLAFHWGIRVLVG